VTSAAATLSGPEPGETGDGVTSELTDALDHLLDPLDGFLAASHAGKQADTHGSGLDEPPSHAPKHPLPSDDVDVAITLHAFEAQAGAQPVVRFTVIDTCPNCGGSGLMPKPDPKCETCAGTGRRPEGPRAKTCPECGGEPCPNCVGTGYAEAERRLRVSVPAGSEDGAQLRVSGQGSVSEGLSVPGDLLLHVRVLPQPRHSWAKRYIALALLLANLAMLPFLLRH
jgi:DnaJ-class molecular chaperone